MTSTQHINVVANAQQTTSQIQHIADSCVVCSIDAANFAQDNSQRIHLIPVDGNSNVAGLDGRAWKYNAANILANAAAYPAKIPGDYHHASLDARKTGAEAPASGWIDPVTISEESNGHAKGIWGTVTWTEAAANAIRNKEFLYISPVFSVDANSNETLALKGFALTHYPNLGELTPVANNQNAQQESPMDEIIEEIREALNLPTASNAAEIKIELDKLFSRVGTLAANSDASFLEQVGLIETRVDALNKKADEAIAANSQMDASEFVPRAEFDRVRTELDSITTDRENKRVDLAVNAALESGVIAPASLDWAKDYCRKDADGFAKFAANSAKVVPLGEKATPSATGAGVLSDEETAVCSQLGVSHEDFLKAKKAEEA